MFNWTFTLGVGKMSVDKMTWHRIISYPVCRTSFEPSQTFQRSKNSPWSLSSRFSWPSRSPLLRARFRSYADRDSRRNRLFRRRSGLQQRLLPVLTKNRQNYGLLGDRFCRFFVAPDFCRVAGIPGVVQRPSTLFRRDRPS